MEGLNSLRNVTKKRHSDKEELILDDNRLLPTTP